MGASARGGGTVSTGLDEGAVKGLSGRVGATATAFGRGSTSWLLISGAGIEISCRGPGRSFFPATIVWLNFSRALGGAEFLCPPAGLISGSFSRKLYQINRFSCG